MTKLNIGCGSDTKGGYVNLDSVKLPGVDIVWNINKLPLPFKNNEFDEILCYHILEHIDDLGKIMKELHRIIAPGGILKIKAPHFTCKNAFKDPTHKHFFTYDSFNYFLKGHEYNYYFDFSFSRIKRKIVFGKKFAIWNWIVEPIANLMPQVYEDTILRVFPAFEIHVELRK